VSERKLFLCLQRKGFVVRERANIWRRWRLDFENPQEMALYGWKIR